MSYLYDITRSIQPYRSLRRTFLTRRVKFMHGKTCPNGHEADLFGNTEDSSDTFV